MIINLHRYNNINGTVPILLYPWKNALYKSQFITYIQQSVQNMSSNWLYIIIHTHKCCAAVTAQAGCNKCVIHSVVFNWETVFYRAFIKIQNCFIFNKNRLQMISEHALCMEAYLQTEQDTVTHAGISSLLYKSSLELFFTVCIMTK